MAPRHTRARPYAEFRHRSQIPMPAVEDVEQRLTDALSPPLLAPRQLERRAPRALRAHVSHVEQRAGGNRLVRLTPDAEQSQRRDGHCQPARLVIFKPCSIQVRRPYQPASLASGDRFVRISQGAL